LPTTRGDLVLLRQAINEDWPITPNVRQAIVDELAGEVDPPNVQRACLCRVPDWRSALWAASRGRFKSGDPAHYRRTTRFGTPRVFGLYHRPTGAYVSKKGLGGPQHHESHFGHCRYGSGSRSSSHGNAQNPQPVGLTKISEIILIQ